MTALEFVGALLGLTNPLEIVAVLLGLANIILLVFRSVWNYPFGILMVLLYFFVFYDAKLYSDALLQIFFLLVQLYGWLQWVRNKAEAGAIVVESLPVRTLLTIGVASLVAIFAWGAMMYRFTDASYPYWDGSVAILSVVAQILLARRYIENWAIWILVDIISIGLYAAKGLWPTLGLYIVFLIISVLGLIEWRRVQRRAAHPGAPASA
jgi:nicotinamide mononucleotide transporter